MSQVPLPPNLHINTLAVHAAVERSAFGENSEALDLTSGYVQPDAASAAARGSPVAPDQISAANISVLAAFGRPIRVTISVAGTASTRLPGSGGSAAAGTAAS